MIIRNRTLRRWKKIRWKTRAELYDILYSLPWGYSAYNNYGFAPSETDALEQFQMQLYCEMTKLLNGSSGQPVVKHMLEISCGRGGGFAMIGLMPVEFMRLAWISRSMPLDTVIIVTLVARRSHLCAGMPCVCHFRTGPSTSW